MITNKVSKNLGGGVTDFFFFFWGGGESPPQNGPAGNPGAFKKSLTLMLVNSDWA